MWADPGIRSCVQHEDARYGVSRKKFEKEHVHGALTVKSLVRAVLRGSPSRHPQRRAQSSHIFEPALPKVPILVHRACG
jgi:hypothetical protein